MSNIALPDQTVKVLEALLTQKRTLDAQIDAIVGTARACLNVPDDYTITDVRTGFVPPRDYIEVPMPGASG